MEKRGQVTIFIIVGVLIIVAIILVFIFQNELGITTRLSTNPSLFIKNCVHESVSPLIANIISTGGIYYTEVNKDSFLEVNSSPVSLLCTTNLSKTSCTSTHPLILTEVEKILNSNSKPKIESCFKQYKSKYPNLQVAEGVLDFSLKIQKGAVFIKIRNPLTISSGEESNYFENFDTTINSNLFDFLSLANIIVNTESSCGCQNKLTSEMIEPGQDPYATNIMGISNCDADLTKLAINYPSYLFYRATLNNNGQKVYTISTKDKYSSENFSFAVINCVTNCLNTGGVCK